MHNPSIVLYEAKIAKLEDRPVPELSDPHDVLVRIKYVGVCGSDVSISSQLSCPSHKDSLTPDRYTSGTMVALERWSTQVPVL